MEDSSYLDFEDCMRGPRDVIMQRLSVYLKTLKLDKKVNVQLDVLDIGSGRGEWLTLLRSIGIDAKGIDSNSAMVEACARDGLDVQEFDAFDYLSSLRNESLDLITAFHIVEHFEFEALQKLIVECKRVLKPEGMLVMETPNPQNLLVGSSEFYVDPTHKRPLPPKLLKYLIDSIGFTTSTVLYLGWEKEDEGEMSSIKDILIGTAMDYSVVAWKQITSSQLEEYADMDQINRLSHSTSLSNKIFVFDKKLRELNERVKQLENEKNG